MAVYAYELTNDSNGDGQRKLHSFLKSKDRLEWVKESPEQRQKITGKQAQAYQGYIVSSHY